MNSHDSFSWTDDRVAVLKQLHANGLTATAIVARLGAGVTRNSVIGKIHRLGLATGRPKHAGGGRPKTLNATQPRNGRGRPRVNPSNIQNKAASRSLDPKGQSLPKEPPRPPDCQPVALTNLKPRHCRWPVGELAGPDTLFCGGMRDLPASWCPYHCELGYTRRQRAELMAPNESGKAAA